MAKLKDKDSSLRNLIYHTEQPVWKDMSSEHRGYRTALWNLLAEHLYDHPINDHYVPADELFFGTSALADEVLEMIIGLYDFKNPKRILVMQPRNEGTDNFDALQEIPEFLEKNNLKEPELLFIAGNKFRVIVAEKGCDIIVAIFF